MADKKKKLKKGKGLAAKRDKPKIKKKPEKRTLPLPKKMGGILPLLPILAGLSALGSVAGGAATVAKVIKEDQAAKKALEESKRHNRMIEAAALGRGLHLKPYSSKAKKLSKNLSISRPGR